MADSRAFGVLLPWAPASPNEPVAEFVLGNGDVGNGDAGRGDVGRAGIVRGETGRLAEPGLNGVLDGLAFRS